MGEKRAQKQLKRKMKALKSQRANLRRASKQHPLILYIDESGNSGLNLFDEQQPVFYAFGLLARESLSTLPVIDSICRELSIKELHGNQLGLSKISAISLTLRQLIIEKNLFFIVSEIDKLFYGGMKFFDVIFDPGTNPGVSNVHVWSRPLKHMLMIRFIDSIDKHDIVEFWHNYNEGNVEGFTELINALAQKLPKYNTDDRTRTLLLDCYNGAMKCPNDVLGSGMMDDDSPNVVSVIMFIHELHKIFHGKKYFINEVIHDIQNQFGITLKQYYNALHQVRVIWTLREFKHEASSVFTDNFTVQSSSSSHGLQLTDIFLYLYSKSQDKEIHGDALLLLNTIIERLHPLAMTRPALMHETEIMLEDLFSEDIDEQSIIKGHKLVEKFDSMRREKLHG